MRPTSPTRSRPGRRTRRHRAASRFSATAVYMAGLRGETLWQIPIAADGAGQPQPLFAGEYGRLRTVAVAPDGSLWLVTSNTDGRGAPRDGDDRILRLTTSSRSSRLRREALQQQFADPGGVGLAASRLHHRTDERTDCRDLATANLVGDIWVLGDRRVDGRGQRPLVRHHDQLTCGDDFVRVPSPASTPLITSRAKRSLSAPSRTSETMRATSPGVIGNDDRSTPSSFARRATSPSHHLRASAGDAPASTVAATRSRAPALTHRLQLGRRDLPIGLQPRPARCGRLGQRRPQLLDPVRARRERNQIGLREVAVVLGLLLRPSGRRLTGVLVPVPRLLDDSASPVQDARLPRDLEAHRALDRPQRVDVLRLGSGAPDARSRGDSETLQSQRRSPPPSVRRRRRGRAGCRAAR